MNPDADETRAEQTASAEPAPPPGAEAKKRSRNEVREWLETVIIAVAIAFAIRAFVVQVYKVEGESMFPTLHTSERVLVNRLVYELRPPKPGEVVVLKDPSQSTRELIKRVVAVGGETIEVRKGIVYVDGKALDETYANMNHPQPEVAPFKVPSGMVYVMGDNRGRSLDSRMMGPISLSNVDGKAFFVFWPLNQYFGTQLFYPRTYQQ